MSNFKTLIAIVGPTAIGKTALSILLAQRYQTEIISADSRQFFREMEIGTAKPSALELQQVPHHFINSHSISSFFSTGDFEIEALQKLEELFKLHDVAIMVGGSGLYINAVCNGLDELPPTDMLIREELNQLFLREGLAPIQNRLSQLDPEYFARVDQSNTQRTIRGLEFVLSTGEKLSAYQTNTKKVRPFNIIKIGLNRPRTILYDQINNRVDQMMERGLLEEVKKLIPYKNLNALNTVGYTELFSYLKQESTLQTAVDKIKQNTRRFAKRQLTWFGKDKEIKWFEPNEFDEINTYLSNNI
jgi:tRNA dimethylallyltransferase